MPDPIATMLILFIHDAPPLQPLLTALARAHPQWRCVVHDDPADAMRLLADEPFDMVCCGWRVSRCFGPDVLRRAQGVSPETMRLLLLPDSVDTAEAARQGLSCAHQVLPLPNTAAPFAASVERLIAVRWLLQDPTLRRVLGGADRLPSPPRLFLALQRVIADPASSTAQAAQVVAQDPGLATRVLRMANSALFSRGTPVVDLDAAAAQLGMQVLAQVVLSCEVFSRAAPPGVDLELLRRQSLLCAQLAARIPAAGDASRLAGTAALLANCAVPLLAGIDRSALAQMRLPRMWTGLPHEAVVAAYLLGLWGMPHGLIEAVAFCHEPARIARGAAGVSVAGAVHIARALLLDAPLDTAWIGAAGLHEQLPQWRQIAASIVDRAALAGTAAPPRRSTAAAPSRGASA
jgi:HD-like signal output (HDOD) protein